MHFLDKYAYGLWGAVVFNILFFGLFTLAVFKPTTKRDWRTLGAFTAFMVALFSEMFGYPLTIYILTSILGNKYPVLDPFTHLNGHLWVALAGGSMWVYSVLHPLSNVLIFTGLIIISIGWKGIHAGNGKLVTSGIYKFVRHPQYSGFTLTIIGFLVQWPTIITIIMAPILLVMYARLSKKEEKVMIETFGQEYLDYKEQVPAFIPNKRITLRDIAGFFAVFRRDNVL
ncbi:isoprenylcysteine carboxylmethyltransferase family protein [Petroclostridium sp. X23]|uniref:methyltransferase family protein n=1 Tax=Petroclostridium sp. X23 TaxID=3045146 RepID=UPI0024ADE507|nr:isoprenylcysteine carboxylmethyltransferase family protein [Petroclostridium sp. X23]WHH60000.1 isoprenylcysteine carboxylmethyltransferase family protein [Petroclostridium sp. X23]